jgi:hypothetical protein
MIISRGLGDLLANNVDKIQKCIKTKYPAEFGDRAFTGCLWELGIAPTDPGPFLLGTSPEPLFGTFQRGNAWFPYNQLEIILKEAVSNKTLTSPKFKALSGMLSWHAKAGGAGRHLIHVVSDMEALLNLMKKVKQVTS